MTRTLSNVGAPDHAKAVTGITGAILAGGRGSRMGGCDKGLVDYRGRPLIEAVLDVATPQVERLLIVANRNHARYRQYGVPVHADVETGFLGPLAGMLTAAMHADTDLILTLPCDVPQLPPDLAPRLLAAMEANNADVSVAHDGRRLQPMVCLWRRALAPTLAAAVQQRQLQLRAWLYKQVHCTVDFADCPDCFANLNTLAELQASARKASSSDYGTQCGLGSRL